MLCLASPYPEGGTDFHLKFLITMLFLALFHPESESVFFCNFLVIMPFLALPYPESESDFSKLFFFCHHAFPCLISFRKNLQIFLQKSSPSKVPAIFINFMSFCHRPRKHHHHQGSGVELELGDSTSLAWEEEFVLAAQRSFRCLQKVSLHLNN